MAAGAFGTPITAAHAVGRPARSGSRPGVLGKRAANKPRARGLFDQNPQQPAVMEARGQPTPGGTSGSKGTVGHAARQPDTSGLFGDAGTSTGFFVQNNVLNRALGFLSALFIHLSAGKSLKSFTLSVDQAAHFPETIGTSSQTSNISPLMLLSQASTGLIRHPSQP